MRAWEIDDAGISTFTEVSLFLFGAGSGVREIRSALLVRALRALRRSPTERLRGGTDALASERYVSCWQ